MKQIVEMVGNYWNWKHIESHIKQDAQLKYAHICQPFTLRNGRMYVKSSLWFFIPDVKLIHVYITAIRKRLIVSTYFIIWFLSMHKPNKSYISHNKFTCNTSGDHVTSILVRMIHSTHYIKLSSLFSKDNLAINWLIVKPKFNNFYMKLKIDQWMKF